MSLLVASKCVDHPGTHAVRKERGSKSKSDSQTVCFNAQLSWMEGSVLVDTDVGCGADAAGGQGLKDD